MTTTQPSGDLSVVRPEDYHQPGDHDWTAAFQRLFSDVNRRCVPDPGGSVPVSTVEIHLAGVSYTVNDTILQQATGRAQGLTIRGIGRRASEIVMTGAAPLLVNNDRWMNVTWYDCSFRSTNKGADFLHSNSTGGAQDWNFVRTEWRGTWNNGLVLDGPQNSNCNSEWVFDRCTVTGSYENAWLWSGKSGYPSQDQFLNFSMRDMKMEPTYGDMLHFDKGGSINVRGGSWIMQGQRPNGAPSRFFYLPNTGPHFDSVSNLLVESVRFELRNGAAQVIDSAWNGQVTFIGCDDTALGFQSFSSAPGFVAHQYRNPGGVTYIGCQLVGHHGYDASAALSRQVATYLSCGRRNWRTAASFLVRTGTNASKLKFVHVADRDGIA